MRILATSGVGIWIELSSVNSALLSEERLRPVLYTIFSLTLVLNVISTCAYAQSSVLLTADRCIALIAFRLWHLRRRVIGISLNADRFSRITRVMVDSAMFYTLCIIVLFAVNIVGNNALYPVSDVIVQVIVSVSRIAVVYVLGCLTR